ncbi:SDR family oxidoreductase [Tetragenococcus muriaticus]|uniref:SDR family oxidoreductase n=1 Tax=Tetragenococcus muriaticus TaxID=64642 RepID=UPI0004297DC7|nr:SDR family oxidoreductase [Tetragenococcus muriaticus]GMA47583.1 oxidoreductase [Tetragenococcus muriaticus]
MSGIKGKVVVITGASSGIGEVTAKNLALQGAKVVLGARREDRLQSINQDIEKEGGESVYQVTDVTSRADVDALADLAIKEYGRIDVLVNNAGIMPQSYLNKRKVDEWDAMIDINIKGVLYGISAVLPTMREQKSGQVINLSSLAGHQLNPGGAVYSGTKFAVRAITETLRQEEQEAGTNLRTTIISPGAVDTELTDAITDPDVKPVFDEVYKSAITPESIARSIAFAIAEDESVTLNEMIISPTN